MDRDGLVFGAIVIIGGAILSCIGLVLSTIVVVKTLQFMGVL